MSLTIFITGAFIAGTINIGIVLYFMGIANTKINKIIDHLKLRYPDKLKELLGDEGVSNNKQSSVVRVKVGKFIRSNDLAQDFEYAQLKKESLLNSKVFRIVLSAVCLIESLFVLIPIYLRKFLTDQAIVRVVPLVVFYGVSSSFWFVYQIFKWNKATNSISGDKREEMVEDNKNIIKFELAKMSKNIYKNYHKWGTMACAFLFFFLLAIFEFTGKKPRNVFYDIQGALFLCGGIYVLLFVGVYRTWRARMAYELIFDQEKKEFNALIINRKEVIKFMVKDIKVVGKEPSQGGFRFYLNNGSWVTWDSAFTNKEQELENLIRSLGVSIRIKSFW